MSKTQILTPPGRLVRGDLYKPSTTDAEGNPLVNKSGPNIGQPRVDYYFELAIPKGPEQHWSQTPWGQLIYAAGRTAFPQQHASDAFAWKVKDGDSQKPNKQGRRPCDQEGFPRHWVLRFSSGFAPKLLRNNGTEQLTEPGMVKLGYWIQVFGTVDGNGSSSQPGVFLNHSMVNLIGYDKEIVVGPDPAAVGFGQEISVPPHVSATPLAAAFNPAPMQPFHAGGPVPGATIAASPGFVAPGSPAGFPPGVTSVPAVNVQPHPGFLSPQVPPAVPAIPAPKQMTAKAAGVPYEEFIAQQWTDALLIQHGYMAA